MCTSPIASCNPFRLERHTNWSLWIDIGVLLMALVILTFGLGHYGLFEPHEGHFAGVAREMVLRGDWITPP